MTSKEKQLTIALLTEKLQRISGKKIVLEGWYQELVVWLKPLTLKTNKGDVQVKVNEVWKFERTPFMYFAVKGPGESKIAVNLDNYKDGIDYQWKEVKRPG